MAVIPNRQPSKTESYTAVAKFRIRDSELTAESTSRKQPHRGRTAAEDTTESGQGDTLSR